MNRHPALLGREAGQGLLENFTGDALHFAERLAALLGREDHPDTPVARVLPSLDPAAFLHAIKQARHADRLDLQKLGEPCLRYALFLYEAYHQAPLRGRQPVACAERLETLAHQPRGVMYKETQS